MFPVYTIGHFLNEPTNPAQFAVLQFGSMDEPDVDDIHRHTFYEVVWVDAGNSRQTIDYASYELAPQSLFFISPGQVHEFEEWEPLSGGTILFTEDFVLLDQQNRDKLFELSFLDNFYANPLLTPDPTDFRAIRHTIDLLCTEQARPDATPAILQPLLLVLLTQIQRSVNRQQPAATPKRYVVLYKQLKTLLDRHFAENRPVSFYADQLNLTQHHLNRVCQDVTGQTAGNVVRARAMLEAKRLLTFTDKPVSEIGEQLGFLDSSYFARVFRAETKLSPVVFREQMSEKYRTSSRSF